MDMKDIITIPKWKLALAALGVLYLIGFAVWGVYAVSERTTQQRGASELASHPERQDEILAERRAEEARELLGLSSEQTRQLATLIEAHTQKAQALRTEDIDDFEVRRERMMALRDVLRKDVNALLTPEQQERLESLPMPDSVRIFGRGGLGGGFGRGEGRGRRPEGGFGRGDGPRGPRTDGGFGPGEGPPAGPGQGQGYGVGRGRGRQGATE